MPKYAQKSQQRDVKSEGKANQGRARKCMNTFQGAFSCPQCSDEFDSKADMLVHVNSRCDGIHYKKTKRFVCPSCANTFAFSYELKYHYHKEHGGLRGLTKDEHSYLKLSKEMEKMRLKSTTTSKNANERFFQCSICKKKYCTASKLRDHVWRRHFAHSETSRGHVQLRKDSTAPSRKIGNNPNRKFTVKFPSVSSFDL